MDTQTETTEIEKLYRDSIRNMSPRERVARSVDIFNWARETLARQIKSTNNSISDRRLKLLVAQRMYHRDADICKLIKRNLENAPD